MFYENFKTEEELRETLEKSDLITGFFLCDYTPAFLSDEFYYDKTFKDCVIMKGSFVSCGFRSCIFDNVIFRQTDFAGTDFDGCEFRDCIFSNVDSGYTMTNTKIGHFSEFFEEGAMMEIHIRKMREKAKRSHE